MTQTKHTRRERVAQILQAALAVAQTVGYNRMTRDQIAAHCGIPSSLIAYHCGTMVELRRSLVRHAIKTNNLVVLAQAIVAKDSRVKNLPDDIKRAALESLL